MTAANGKPGMPFASVDSGESIVAGITRFESLFCGVDEAASEIELVTVDGWSAWVEGQSAATKKWLEIHGKGSKGKNGVVSVPIFEGDGAGGVRPVFVGLQPGEGLVWSIAEAYGALPNGSYKMGTLPDGVDPAHVEIGWALGGYAYKVYKSSSGKSDGTKTLARVTGGDDASRVDATLGAIYLVRDLISTPTEDLGPANLATAACKIAEGIEGASCSVVVGDDLLSEDSYFPQVHIVGRAAAPECAPRLIDLKWNEGAKETVTLVGKGVCYDTGGLSIKGTSGMLTMKKDMGGAAHVLALGYMIMKTGLDVGLRVLVPAVENSIGPNSYRPGDVIVARNKLTTEVTNTDAEGRLVLADALVAACEENPSLVIDFATLTGAQRVALGTDIPSFWVQDEETATLLSSSSVAEDDLMWRLPLHKPYRKKLDSAIADVKNCATGGYGGAITAALYLNEFVADETPWIHVDLMAFNPSSRPGRPEGGEAMGLRGVYAMLKAKFAV